VSVPTTELSAPESRARPGPPSTTIAKWFSGGRLLVVLAGAALIIGILSLLVPSTPSYDPWSWLIWGREIIHLDLKTTGGPTWKPLPVIFTTIFSIFGKAEPNLWLVVARAGAALAAAMVFRVTFRLTYWIGGRPAADASPTERLVAIAPGVLAGVIATVGLLFSSGFISDNALGYSEGLMTALALIAVDRHFDGYPRQAFAIGFLAALDRPEIWLFWGPYGLWLFWKDPDARKLVIGLFVLIPVLWFLPEYWGSGHFLRGVNRAHHPRSNSPAFASCPFCNVLVHHAWPTVLLRIKILAALAVAGAGYLLWRAHRARSSWRFSGERDRALVAVIVAGLLGVVWFVVIAILTQAGFSGNNRYLVLGSALIEIAGGVGWGWLAIELGRRAAARLGAGRSRGRAAGLGAAGVAIAALGFLVLPNFVGTNLIDIQRTHRSLVYQAHLRQDLNTIVSDYGGKQKLLACGSVMTEGFQVPMIAWALGTHSETIEAPPSGTLAPASAAPNVILQARDTRNAALLPLPATIINWEREGVDYQLVKHQRTFRLFTACRK
jgi:hypothetical protein